MLLSWAAPFAHAKSRVIKWRDMAFRSRHDTVLLVNEAKAGCTFVTGITNEQILRIEQKKIKWQCNESIYEHWGWIYSNFIQTHYVKTDKQVTGYPPRKYSRVSFCDCSFYDDSLLWQLCSRTEYYLLVVHHCRNSSVLSLLSALLALIRCAFVSSFSILVQFFFKLIVIFPPMPSIKKTEKKKNQDSSHYFLSWCLLTTAWVFFNKIKSYRFDIFFNYLCNFLYRV